MVEKGKISAFQMALLLYIEVIATAILTAPGMTTILAGRDMWISPIIGSVIGFVTVLIMYNLHKIYPNESIIQYSTYIIGKVPGKIIGFFLLFLIFHSDILIIRDYGELIMSAFLENTPLIVVMGSLVVLCAFNIYGGVEVIGRVTSIFIPIYVFLFLLIIVLLIQNLDPQKMFPVMENGLLPPTKGAALPQVWFSQLFLISFLLPLITDQKRALKYSMLSVFFITFTLVSTNITLLFIFGEKTANFTYPLITATKVISIADFVQNLEAAVMAIWVAGIFIKLSFFYYALVIGTVQWLNLSDYRPLVFPFGLLTIAGAVWVTPNLQEMNHFLRTIYPFYGTFISTLIPGLLLLIVIVRKRISKKEVFRLK
ncbi:GerAB/ArcD/ProY family transporter [Alteribacillus bidgolensis]|uniref:Spore germination protein KB n=1 Tax=Alteribacillus bidgolensis TaxID=930129 RepID=A0A1G8FXF2_9BACI|nr:endospore germination permease [Alteribacillus bidgolensis]SDH86777.1 spore germination protein KB [Alteribacillus bidgolensis]